MIFDPRFRELWRVPVLVWEFSGQHADSAEVTLPGIQQARPRLGEPLLFEVRKAPDVMNAVLGVTIGRTSNNDIVINDASVSRFHAVLIRDRSGAWMPGDAGSSNGTFVRGERVRTMVSVPLGEDEHLVLGSVPLRFLVPEAFFRYLDALTSAAKLK